MSDGIEVAKVHGHAINYDAEKKQFVARVGGREIKKPSQREIEKVISKFVKGDARTKGIVLYQSWGDVHVVPIEIVSLRGRRVQFKSGEYLEGEDVDKVYVHDEKVLQEARELQLEYKMWKQRWEALLKKAKPIDVESLK